MAKKWSVNKLMNFTRAFQPSCILFAAADLDIFTLLHKKAMTAKVIANKLKTNLRATIILMDALVALDVLKKKSMHYSINTHLAALLSEQGAQSILPMIRHQANCLRRWVQLAEVVKTSNPAERFPSIRGQKADQKAFVEAMDNFSRLVIDEVIGCLKPLSFKHLLDVGSALGTWTIAFLKAVPDAKATIFDLPEVIPLAKKHIADAGLTKRVTFVKGDFYKDNLPCGTDFAWLGAIAHQNSREQNIQLFSKVNSALAENGTIIIRDVVMDKSHTKPPYGALFAVNMLVATKSGNTYSFEQYRECLQKAGFERIRLIRKDEFMNSLIRAVKIKKKR